MAITFYRPASNQTSEKGGLAMQRYRIAQNSDFLGRDRWRWWVWIEASPEDLLQVASVTWKLHASFPQPVVESTDREHQFRLERIGWGVFTLGADLNLLDGSRLCLQQRLELSYPEEGRQVASKTVQSRSLASQQSKPPSVFLSYPAEDSRFATRLREELNSSGFEVTGSQDFRPGLPWEVALRKVLQRSDGFVMVASDDALQGSVLLELEEARKAQLPTLILLKQGVELDNLLPSEEVLPFNPGNFAATISEVLARVQIKGG
jgi:hypothetical protein